MNGHASMSAWLVARGNKYHTKDKAAMKRIAIIDDDRNYAENIREEIRSGEWGEAVRIDLYEHPLSFLSRMKEEGGYDLCLSDIEMPGKNGIELAKEIRRTDPNVLLIFLTAYPRYAVLGYRVEAYDYILKERFREEWKRVSARIRKEFERADQDFYLVEMPNYFERIPLSQVQYIYKEKKYALFVLAEREVAVRKTLKQVQEELAEYRQFIQVERGYIANIEKIRRFAGRELEMENGHRIPLGRIRTAEVSERIHSYYHGG